MVVLKEHTRRRTHLTTKGVDKGGCTGLNLGQILEVALKYKVAKIKIMESDGRKLAIIVQKYLSRQRSAHRPTPV